MNLRNFTIYDLFKRSARLYGGETGFLFNGRGITFGELFDQIKALMGWFGSKGISKGDRIAVLGPNCPQFFNLMGGIAALGAISAIFLPSWLNCSMNRRKENVRFHL